jgi:hypothetical protein
MRKQTELTKRERLLLNLFRELKSRHSQDAFLFLMLDVAWGSSTKQADKSSLESFIASACRDAREVLLAEEARHG